MKAIIKLIKKRSSEVANTSALKIHSHQVFPDSLSPDHGAIPGHAFDFNFDYDEELCRLFNYADGQVNNVSLV